MDDTTTIETKYKALSGRLDEATLRLWAATEAHSLGRGGVSTVAKAIGMSRTTIHAGLTELNAMVTAPIPKSATHNRVRTAGGGRKKLSDKDANLLRDLDALVEPTSRGDPMSPLRWTCKSTYKLAEELNRQGHTVCQRTICDLLGQMNFSLQSTRKTKEGGHHRDRDAQFCHIAQEVANYQSTGDPVISVDTKKKELIGDFKNAGQEWQPKGKPEEVRVYDFIDPELGKVAPYGVYDVTEDQGWVSVGMDHDTARFAAEAIRRWWRKMGVKSYPDAQEVLITADGGGSNGSRNRLWKVALQELANGLGLTIWVCHFPPGTSKWNKIEHRMFSHITQNWRGRPLISHEVIINLIAATTTQTGLAIQAELDAGHYPTGVKVSDEELAMVNLQPDEFHGDWNYRIAPTRRKK